MVKVTMIGWLCLFATVAFTVAGQLLVKAGMLGIGSSPTHLSALPHFMWKTFTNHYVVLGLGCAVLAAVCWTVAVSRSALSVAYPFMALAIVLVLALSGAIFDETIPAHRWLGVLIVCIGLVVTVRPW